MNSEEHELDEMPAEIDFSHGVRGHFAGRTDSTTIVMEIDADVARAFPSAAEVNTALRVLMNAAASMELQAARRAS